MSVSAGDALAAAVAGCGGAVCTPRVPALGGGAGAGAGAGCWSVYSLMSESMSAESVLRLGDESSTTTGPEPGGSNPPHPHQLVRAPEPADPTMICAAAAAAEWIET
eukprot:SAG25_NODE_277_length_10482_cov_6.715919_11_plen_107_part_00